MRQRGMAAHIPGFGRSGKAPGSVADMVSVVVVACLRRGVPGTCGRQPDNCSRSRRFISLPLALRGSGVALKVMVSGTL